MNKKPKKVFQDGPIAAEKIATSISNHQSKTSIEAHSIFLGQVSADSMPDQVVKGIVYSSDEEKAEAAFYEIREEAFSKFDLTCMHIYHSLGLVNAGELYLFVFTSSTTKEQATMACDYLVDEICKRVAINEEKIVSN
ncbi:MAG: molybdenum cofactor biosynthesis protein MoaE [Cyclobacteriaceae bacterium]